jgi:isovaleryl-CoA dehydrogenase
VPEEDGGAGMDATAAVIVHEEMAKYDPGFTLAYLAHSMLFVNNFYQCSNTDQRERYLGKVVSGEWLAGMGMTEPGAGTDVLGMTTSAVRDGDHYVLNGSKTYITNGPEGDCFQVYAKVDGKVSAFVVDRSMPGFDTSNKIDKCGMRASTMGELFFDDCRVPAANLLGAEGSGLQHMMRNLELERITLAAMSCGIAERCVEIMVDYAAQRKAFGKHINEFGQIQRFIAESYATTQAMKALTYEVARDISPHKRNRIGSDAAKLFAAPGWLLVELCVCVCVGYCVVLAVCSLV